MAFQMKFQPATADSSASASLDVRIETRFDSGFMLDVGFTAQPGVTVLFGPSGAGKTSVLQCVAGLLKPGRGRIALGERVLFDSKMTVDMPLAQRRIGYVFQTLALFPHMSVRANVAYGLNGLERVERNLRVSHTLESFGLAELADRRPSQISVGQQQRVALARALVTEPLVLLLDEPLSALDLPTRSLFLDDLRRWIAEHRVPVLHVTHSRDEVFALAQNVVLIEQGKVLAQGSPLDVLAAPRHETTAQLAGFENIYDATVTAAHEAHGTMMCRVAGAAVELQTPLIRTPIGSGVRIAIRAGDILMASEQPRGLSARNLLRGRIVSLTRRDVMVIAHVDCGGVLFEVHLTPGAQDELGLEPGREVWLVIKTYSCHLLYQGNSE
jgi:molybdate transport system ATP-binding protein